MRGFDKVIVSCALTGAIHVPSLSPYLPKTPEELVEEGVAAAEAGASIVHVHVRDPETGEPASDESLFRQVASGIGDECDVVVQPTTGGGLGQSIEERAAVVPALEPEMASCNMGSMNFGLYPMLGAIEEFEYDWEAEYLEGTRDLIFPNTFENVEDLLELFDEAGTKPELECYDVGHLYNTKHFVDRGLLRTPIHLQFVLGVHGGIAAKTSHLQHMIDTAEELFGDDYSFSVVGAGRMQFPLCAHSVSNGGHARVGLEDNLYLRRGELAESNADLVEKLKDVVYELVGRELATPEETRQFLGLKGRDAVAF